MTIWSPKLLASDAPIYVRIADRLERDVADGVLVAGSRLPTHRDLARRLGVTVVTVTRAYAEAAERGLVETTVGRGSFVRAQRRETASTSREIDLATNEVHASERTLPKELTQRLAAALNTSYGPAGGSDRHRAAGATWLARTHRDATPERVLLTTGAQQAMLAAIAAQTKPGDAVLAESVTFHGIRAIAALLHLKLEPVAIDRHGMLPDALAKAAKKRGAKIVYITPTLQNPTGVVMPEKRRRDLAAVADRHGLTILEDDVYGFLAEDAPAPITSHVEGVFLTGCGKSLAPALRVGWLLAPQALVPRIQSALAASTIFPSPLGAEIAATWIEDGTADKLVAEKRHTIANRHRLARRVLGRDAGGSDERSPHLWLELPRRWTPEGFEDELRARGVRVAGAHAFATGADVPRAARICLGSPATASELETGLHIITSVLRGEERVHSVV
ncbi:MAG: PLP-dependent aminotransferase family protein [Acidobacteria bacterium]|nr:PLP-dependent aminotransferase family protein [Acidobacteriota bacterium]